MAHANGQAFNMRICTHAVFNVKFDYRVHTIFIMQKFSLDGLCPFIGILNLQTEWVNHRLECFF